MVKLRLFLKCHGRTVSGFAVCPYPVQCLWTSFVVLVMADNADKENQGMYKFIYHIINMVSLFYLHFKHCRWYRYKCKLGKECFKLMKSHFLNIVKLPMKFTKTLSLKLDLKLNCSAKGPIRTFLHHDFFVRKRVSLKVGATISK